MIEAINITKHYLVQGKRRAVFKDLSLRIGSGDRVALMGANGAGKSTLLRILTGIELPNQGEVIINGRLSWPVGLSSGFLPPLTGRENIKFVCRLLGVDSKRTQEIHEFVEDFAEISDYFDMPLQTYSSGMKARLAFGLSMAIDFDTYVVDEALAVGDVRFRQKCEDVFSKKSKDCGMVMVSHSMGVVRSFCDKGIFLKNGKIIQSNDIEEIIGLYNQMKKNPKLASINL